MGTPDEKYMRMALNLAKKGLGMTSPNPMVGAVIVNKGIIVGKGHHEGPGKLHAEAVAIRESGANASGATLYVNLEPCCHTDKRTPPCTREIISSGITRVAIGVSDPNPAVNGLGISELIKAGITVDNGILNEEASRLNEAYIRFIKSGLPFVILKSAASLDGKIALSSGESRWITGKPARRYAHMLRSMVDAVMVGVGTVIADDPMLNVRHVRNRGRQPVRIIVDTRLRIPLKSRVLDINDGQQTMIVTTRQAPDDKIRELESSGVRIIMVDEDSRINLKLLMGILGKSGITSILIEGGSEINASALRAGIVDKAILIYSSRIIGGSDSIGMVGGHSPKSLDDSVFLKDVRLRRLGDDIMVEGYIQRK